MVLKFQNEGCGFDIVTITSFHVIFLVEYNNYIVGFLSLGTLLIVLLCYFGLPQSTAQTTYMWSYGTHTRELLDLCLL